MGQSLKEIAQQLRDTDKKVQLIYAFNGVGKTRLSREFKELIAPKDEEEHDEETPVQILYYNAFTEDLFYWDNDLDEDKNRKLIIQQNNFTDWILKEQGQGNNIIGNFQNYTNDKLTPRFNEEYIIKDENGKNITIRAYSEITFSITRGDNTTIDNIKISKGEESCLIWCIFYSILEQIKNILIVAEPDEREISQFNSLKYVFIDDPVSSLDENHLIELAVNLSMLITEISNLKFIITTHNPLFYNVLCNELKRAKRLLLEKADDGTYRLTPQKTDSPFSYHLFLLTEIEKAIQSGNLKKYHYNFLRQILEKTSTFLGYKSWEDLLPDDSKKAYYDLIINICSHGKHAGEETYLITDSDKRVLRFLVKHIRETIPFQQTTIK